MTPKASIIGYAKRAGGAVFQNVGGEAEELGERGRPSSIDGATHDGLDGTRDAARVSKGRRRTMPKYWATSRWSVLLVSVSSRS